MTYYLTHKRALIIFWSLTIVTGISWGITILFLETSIMTQTLARILTITDLLFIPMIIMIPLIGSGYFQKEKQE